MQVTNGTLDRAFFRGCAITGTWLADGVIPKIGPPDIRPVECCTFWKLSHGERSQQPAIVRSYFRDETHAIHGQWTSSVKAQLLRAVGTRIADCDSASGGPVLAETRMMRNT